MAFKWYTEKDREGMIDEVRHDKHVQRQTTLRKARKRRSQAQQDGPRQGFVFGQSQTVNGELLCRPEVDGQQGKAHRKDDEKPATNESEVTFMEFLSGKKFYIGLVAGVLYAVLIHEGVVESNADVWAAITLWTGVSLRLAIKKVGGL